MQRNLQAQLPMEAVEAGTSMFWFAQYGKVLQVIHFSRYTFTEIATWFK
jgi:hypothetical protein